MTDPHDPSSAAIDEFETLLRAVATLPIPELRQAAATWCDEDIERLLHATEPADDVAEPLRQNRVTRRRLRASAAN